MKKLSLNLLAETVVSQRKAKKITQVQLSQMTGINRSILSRLESEDYMPSVDQLQALSEVLDFNPVDLFIPTEAPTPTVNRKYNIAVAGTGYVGLSLSVLLAQHNHVTAVDIIQEKVDKLNEYISPIQDEYIEKYLSQAKAGERELDLTATTDGAAAYADADYSATQKLVKGETRQFNHISCQVIYFDGCPHVQNKDSWLKINCWDP